MFAQKLDFLMSLTNTHNIELAQAIDVDASAISRLRSGKRKLPKTQDFLPTMGAFFAKQLINEYQKKTAADTICPGKPWPDDAESAAEQICLWLVKGNENQLSSVETLFSSVSELSVPDIFAGAFSSEAHEISTPTTGGLYYGIAGVHQAVLDFFDAILASGKPRNVYLFSDEDTRWMSIDPQFVNKWNWRFKSIISMGCKVKIIHNTTRPLDDMLTVIAKWLPIYTTGTVEPYYYPKIRDGVYRRTLFVADDLAALHTSTIDGLDDDALVHLLFEPQAVSALKAEYFNYLKLCRPMFEIVYDSERYLKLLIDYDKTPADYYYASYSPSIYTMPLPVLDRICYRSGDYRLMELREGLSDRVQSRLENLKSFELIGIPSAQQIAKNAIPVGISSLLGIPGCYYTCEEYAAHLQSISEFAREHPNYRYAISDSIATNTIINCKDGVGAILSKCDNPSVSFAFDQSMAVDAFSAYMRKLFSGTLTAYNLKYSLSDLMRRLKYSR